MNYFIAYTAADNRIWGRGNNKNEAFINACECYEKDHWEDVEWWYRPKFKELRCTKELYDLFATEDIVKGDTWNICCDIARVSKEEDTSIQLVPETTDFDKFIDGFKVLSEEVYNTAKDRGWWDCPDADRLDKIVEGSFTSICHDDIHGKGGSVEFLADLAKRLRKANDGEAIALMHSELSEGLEAVRKGDPPDSHIPEFTGLEAEFADVLIRIMNFSHSRKLKVAEAVIAKMKYNKTRAYKHGNKKF